MCTQQQFIDHPLLPGTLGVDRTQVRSWDPAAALFRPSLWMRRLWKTMLTWQERASSRHHLATRGDRELADIGLSRLNAEREIYKSFWRT